MEKPGLSIIRGMVSDRYCNPVKVLK